MPRPRAGGAADPGDRGTVASGRRAPADPVRLGVPSSRLDGFARYELGEELGRGGLGMVVSVHDRSLRRDLALKTLLRPDRRSALESFIEEAQITGQLEHPNIVPVHELGHDPEGRPYLAMKKVHGRTLGEVIEESHKRPDRSDAQTLREESRLLEVFLKVCDAVGYAHSRGVIHRDLKPPNVMVGEFGEVLVMDWGLAKPIGAPGNPERDRQVISDRRTDGLEITADGKVAGTPTCMAPEQAEGKARELDERCDIYALGVILYVILAGRNPFTGRAQSLPEMLGLVRDGDFDPPSTLTRHRRVPRELEAVVLKAMATHPDDRYATVGELSDDIRNYLEGRALSAADYSPWQLLIKWAKRNKAAVIGGTSTAAALLIGVIVAVWLISRTELEKLQAAEAGRIEHRDEQRADAEQLFARSGDAWADAITRPFNPSDPQAWFSETLPPWLDAGRALQEHDDPPAAWCTTVRQRADELQDKALSVDDWALARVVVKQLESWRVLDADALATRRQQIMDAEKAAEMADRARLQSALERIARAESPPDNGDARTIPFRLVPGELEERARQVAQGGGRSQALTRATLEALADKETAPPASLRRRFLIEVLGRRGDTVTVANGIDAGRLVYRRMQQAPDPDLADEVARWVMAAARLQAVDANAFGSQGRLGSTFERLTRSWPRGSPVALAVQNARDYLELAEGGDLPSRVADPVGHRARLTWLAESTAMAARSGRAYTEMLVTRAVDEAERLTAHQLAFVLHQLGLHGDCLPPRDSDPDRAAIPVLRRFYEALPEEWMRNTPPAGVSRDDWHRRRVAASSAVVNLARLQADDVAPELLRRRFTAGANTLFSEATMLANALFGDAGYSDETVVGLIARASGRLEAGDVEGAMADLNLAIQRDPSHPAAFNNRAQARDLLGDTRGAVDDYTRALELDATLANVWANRAMARFLLGDVSGAISDCDEAIRLDPDLSMAWSHRGLIRLRSGNPAAAIPDFTRALQANPDHVESRVNRAAAYKLIGDLRAALDDCNRALQQRPEAVYALVNRGAVYEDLGRVREAFEDYNRAVILDATCVEAIINRGRMREQLGDPRGAAADLDRACRLAPDSGDAFYARGMYRKRTGNLSGARDDFQHAAEVRPGHAWSWLALGGARQQLGDLPGAIRAFDRAVELAPDDPIALNNRATARQDAGDMDGAISDYRRATELQPGQWAFWANYAHCLGKAGRVRESAAAFDNALQLCPPASRSRVLSLRRDALGY